MGLFINKDGHPGVYQNKADILEQNQHLSTIDPLSEWVKEQKEANEELNHQIRTLQSLVKKRDISQSNQWRMIRNRLNDLQESELRHERFENDVMESLWQLNAKSNTFDRKLANESALNQKFIEQVQDVNQSTSEMAVRLEEIASVNVEIAKEMKGQIEQQNRLSEQLVKQEEVQAVVMTRLDNQEGLTEKMLRQMDHLRAVLYERSNFLAEKIEEGYHTTSHYIAKLLAGPDQPTVRFMLNKHQELEKKSPDEG